MTTRQTKPHPIPAILARDLRLYISALETIAADLRKSLEIEIRPTDTQNSYHCGTCTRMAIHIQRRTDRLWLLSEKILKRYAAPDST